MLARLGHLKPSLYELHSYQLIFVMPAGKPLKEFHEYLCEATRAHVSHADYLKSPATTFLKYTIEAKSAIDLCIRKFPIKADGSYTSDSLDSLQHLSTAMLSALMGHFETFQKTLYAGMFDFSVYSTSFQLEPFVKKLTEQNVFIDVKRLSAYRNIGTSSVGSIIADSLKGWHSPEKVNEHFGAFKLNYAFLSNADIRRLQTLWQLRHSIVHTGGTLTLPDAQKVTDLNSFGNRNIAFEKYFIFEVARKLHPLVKRSTEGIGNAYKARLIAGLSADVLSKINTFFEVRSSIGAWLR